MLLSESVESLCTATGATDVIMLVTKAQLPMEMPLVARSLEQLEAVIERGLQLFYEVGDALAEVRDRRLYREAGCSTFEAYCRDKWGISRPRAYQMIDAASVHGLLSTIVDIPLPANEAQVRELVPLKDDELAIVDVWRELRAEYGSDVTAARVKRLVTNRVRRIARERAGEARRQQPVLDLPPDVTILTGDMRELSKQLDGDSVDVILTDPPYAKEYLSLWSDLARVAARVLRPGGWLVTYSGQSYLPQVVAALGEHLVYYWLAGLHHLGQRAQRYEKRIQSAMKPILIYTKLPIGKCPAWFIDLVKGPAPSNDYHEWGQSVEPVRYLIGRFSKPGDLVIDPFLGGGTTAVACVQTGRHFVGFEIDPAVADVARRRVGEVCCKTGALL